MHDIFIKQKLNIQSTKISYHFFFKYYNYYSGKYYLFITITVP